MYDDLTMQAGQVVAGKYRVNRVLGVGGMGIVVAATHMQLDQLVALKFIRHEGMRNPDVVSRFEREARAAVRLRSEHAARIIDVGRLDSGVPYMVMEYLDGQDLAMTLAQQGRVDVRLACDYIIQACDAISEAHALGIVHRDLKPGNLFLAQTAHGQQSIKVLDFGISKSLMTSEPSVTGTKVVIGSPGYMSPEQMRSTRNVDGRSDIWSLGVVLYELVAGRVPFDGESLTALCLKVAMEPHPALPEMPAALPKGFEAVINCALAKDPAQRYPSAIALASALALFATPQGQEIAHRLVRSPMGAEASASYHIMQAGAETTLGASAGQAIGRDWRRWGWPGWVLVGGTIAVAAATVAGAIAMWPPTSTNAGQPAPMAAEPLRLDVEPRATIPPTVTTSTPLGVAPQEAVAPDAGIVDAASAERVQSGPATSSRSERRGQDKREERPRRTSVVNPYESPD